MTTTAKPPASSSDSNESLSSRYGAASPRSMTKILATLGPSTDAREIIRKLVDSGASMFRLNFSHGSFKDHAQRLGRSARSRRR